MRLYRIADCKFINDLSGMGAALSGGRWNSKGVFLLYTSQNISLAQLETLKRYELSRKEIPNKCLIVLDVPGRSVISIRASDIGRGWRRDPAPQYLQRIGNIFSLNNTHLLLKVPSALNPTEYNYLINPSHKDFSKIKVIDCHPIQIDRRLARPAGVPKRKRP